MTSRISNPKFLTVLPSVPSVGLGWEVFVRDPRDWTTTLAYAPRFEALSLSIAANDFGMGSVTLDGDDRILHDPLPAGLPGTVLDRECLWQFYEDGVLRHEWLGEDTEEDVVTDDESRVTKVSGRTTEKVLEWAKHIPVWGEAQEFSITGTPTGGTYKLQFKDQTTATIAYNASAATVKARLAALSNITATDIDVVKDGWTYTIQFKGAYAKNDVPLVRPKNIALTGGSSPSVEIGSADQNTWNDLAGQWTGEPAAAAIVDELASAQARDVLPFVTLLFDKETDSHGNPWADISDTAVSGGESLLALLQRLAETYGWEFRMLPGFRLFLVQDGLGIDHSAEAVFFVSGQQLGHSRKGTTRDVATDVYVQSAQYEIARSTGASAATPWKRESWYEGGDAASISAASQIAGASLSLVKDRKIGRTVKVLPDAKSRVVLDDYDVNDWISIEDETGEREKIKIVGITISVDANAAVDVELEIQTKFEARAVKTQRILGQIGALQATGGAGTSPQRTDQVNRASRLSDLVDVDITTGLVDGAALIWDDATGSWVPGASAGVAPAIVATSSAYFTTGASPTITVPASASVGDTLLIFVGSNFPASATGPAGWSYLALSNSPWLNVGILTKPCASGDPGSTITVPISGAANEAITLYCVVVSGAMNFSGFAIARADTGTTLNAGPIVLAKKGDLQIGFGVARATGTLTVAPGSLVVGRTTDSTHRSGLYSRSVPAAASLLETVTSSASTSGIAVANVTIGGIS